MTPQPACSFSRLKPGQASWRTLLPLCLRKAQPPRHTDTTAGELLLQFTASARAVHEGFMRIFGPGGFSDHKFTVLVVLLAIEPESSTPSDLAVQAGITRASMTDVLDGLERRRWIERRRDPQNRRTTRVTLTATGRRAVIEAASLYLQIAADLVRPIPPADIAAFTRVCTALQDAGKALPGDRPHFEPSSKTS